VDAGRSWRTESAARPRSSFATSIDSDTQTRQDRRVGPDRRVDSQSTHLHRCPSHCRNLLSAVDYRRDATERLRHLHVLHSNQTLDTFIRVLRQEKEAKATAALFSTPSSTLNCCRRRSRTISFAVDEERHRPVTPSGVTSQGVTSSAVTSSRDGTGNACRCRNKPASSMLRCSSPADRQRSSNAFHPRLDKQRHQLTKASNARDYEDRRAKCFDEDRRRRTSSPRPAR